MRHLGMEQFNRDTQQLRCWVSCGMLMDDNGSSGSSGYIILHHIWQRCRKIVEYYDWNEVDVGKWWCWQIHGLITGNDDGSGVNRV